MKKVLSITVVLFLLSIFLCSCSSVSLDTSTLELKIYDTATLVAESEDAPIIFSSSDDSIATVDDQGTVTAIDAGEATITATNAKGKTAQCVVTVSHIEAESISVTREPIAPSITYTFPVRFTPENTTDTALMWSSDNSSIATVDENGTVTGIAPGDVSITATANNGVSNTFTLSVLPLVEQLKVEEPITVTEGDTIPCPFTMLPDNHYSESLILTSSDENIVKVNGTDIKAVKAGTAIITAETEYSHCTAECTITVDYAELTVSVNGNGYSSSSMASINGHTVFSKTMGFDAVAVASGGSGDYQYSFSVLRNGSVIKSSGWQSSSKYSVTVGSGGTYTVQVTVKDSRGETATASETSTMS